MKKLLSKTHHLRKMALWKWLVIIFIAVAMPLFFSFVNDIQIQQALINSPPEQTPSTQNEAHQ